MPFNRRQPHTTLQTKPAEEKAKMFAIRNAINEAQEAIVNYNWIDPDTGKKVGGLVMFGVLMTMAKHCWNEAGVSFPGHKNIAYSVGVNRRYIPLAQRAAVHAGIINPVEGKSKFGTRSYIMSVGLVEHFLQRDWQPIAEALPDAEGPIPEALRGFVPDPEGDALEEELMYIEDDLEESLDDALEELMYIAEDLEGTSDEEFAQAARPYWEAGVIGKSCENLTPGQKRERFLQVCREMGLPDAAVLRQSQEQLRIAT